MTRLTQPRSLREQYLSSLALLAACALLTELLVLRLMTRTLIHIPGLEAAGVGIQAMSELGRIAFGTAVVLVTAIMTATAVVQTRRGRPDVGFVVALFVLVSGLAAMQFIPESIVDAATVGAVLAVPTMLAIRSQRAFDLRWLAITCFVAAFVAASVPTIAGKLNPGISVPILGWSYLAEALAISGAITLLAGRYHRVAFRSVGYGTAAAVVVFGALTTQPATVQTLMLWNFGLAGYFDSAVYAVAMGCIVYAAHASWTSGERTVAIGLAFIVSGGIGLHSSLQSAAFILGIAVLTDPSVITPGLLTDSVSPPTVDRIDGPVEAMRPAGRADRGATLVTNQGTPT